MKHNINAFLLLDDSFLNCLENGVAGQDSLSKAATCHVASLVLIIAAYAGGNNNNG